MGNCGGVESYPDDDVEKCDAGRSCRSVSIDTDRPYDSKLQVKRPTRKDFNWPSGRIPYILDSSLNFNKHRIERAMRCIEENSRLKFVQRTDQKIYLSMKKDAGCWYYEGDVGHPMISLGIGCESFGTVLHELMHALGFPHEQRRPDRDKYITIQWKNIVAGNEPQFYKLSWDEYRWTQFPFDFKSIMMYDDHAFSKNGRITIEARNGRPIPRREELSDIDKKKLRLL